MRPSRRSRVFVLCLIALTAGGQSAPAAQVPADTSHRTLLVPDAVWDGIADAAQRGWAVMVRGNRIEAAGPIARLDAAGAERVELPGTTLIPGLIEGHSHLFLHPYNETLWDDQVLKEPLGYRIAEAIAHAGT